MKHGALRAADEPIPPPARRKRRTREDVVERIREAARRLFAERGYATATTREIARLADVSETLLFRHYGDKATLFSEVVTGPFQLLMEEFVRLHPDPLADPLADATRDADMRRFTRQVFELFEGHAEMFRALLAGPAAAGEDAAPDLRGLAQFFEQSVLQVQRRYDAAGMVPPFDLGIGVRLGFGMIAASVLLRDSLFPGQAPERNDIIAVLEHFITYALAGPTD